MNTRIKFIEDKLESLKSSKVFGEVTEGYVFVTKIAGPEYPWAGTSHYYCRRVQTPAGYVSPLAAGEHHDADHGSSTAGAPPAAGTTTQRRRLQTGGSATDGSTNDRSTNDDSTATHDDGSATHNDDGSAAANPTTAAGDYCPAEEGCVMYNGRQVWFDPSIDYSEDNHANCLEQGFCWETPNCPDYDNAKMEDVEFW